MIDIRIEGYSVDLTPGFNLVLERFNPLLDFNAFPGNRVYGFTLPITPRNRKIFGYFEQPQIGYRNRKYYCEKFVDGLLIERGFVKFQDAKTHEYNLFFSQNLSEAFGDLQQVPLSQINFGSESVPAFTAAANPLTDPYCLPVIENAGFYANQSVSGFADRMNNYQVGSSTYHAVGRVPQFFLRWVLQQYGAMTGWTFQGDFMNHPDLQRLLLFNLYSLDGATSITYQNHLPELTMPQLLVGLRQLFNLFVEFDVQRKRCTLSFSEDVLASGLVMDWTRKVATEFLKVPDLQSRLELSYDIDSNDALMKPIPAIHDKYTTPETSSNEGGSLTPIRSRLSTLTTNSVSGRAMTSQPGRSLNNRDSTNAPIPKLLFWNGLVSSEPRATNAQGDYKLTWHGSNNLRETCYQRFENFKASTFLLKKNVFLSPLDLAHFSFKQRVYIQGVHFLVGALKVKLSANGAMIPGEVDLWRV